MVPQLLYLCITSRSNKYQIKTQWFGVFIKTEPLVFIDTFKSIQESIAVSKAIYNILPVLLEQQGFIWLMR